ncbi:MAG: hypothetical protein HFG24_05860, partial [Anaerotruncus sp.]|nr:hypothetical protein [Anaerotruncus sp.]
MGIFDMLQKGLPDWHLLLNKNFNAAQAKFDGLDTQMSNKAEKNRVLQSDLYAQFASKLQNPNVQIDTS